MDLPYNLGATDANLNRLDTAREYGNRTVRSDLASDSGKRSAKAWGCSGRSAGSEFAHERLDTSAHRCGDGDASVVDARASLRVVLTKGLRQWVRGPRGPGVHPTDAGPSYRQC